MRRKGMQFAATCFLAVLSVLPVAAVRAQEPGEQAGGRGGLGQFAGMQRVMGQVTAASADKLTVKAEDGTMYQVTTTPNTRMMKSGGVAFKVTDLKPGDGVMAAGNLDAPNKTMHAAMLVMIDAEQVKQAAAARTQMMANLGKTLIMGRVTAIDLDNAKLTIQRPDNVSQTITLDESTSFRRGMPGRIGAGEAAGMGFNMRPDRGANGGSAPAAAPDAGESITLADVKVGDNINGPGTLKNGAFVPTQLVVRTPRAPGTRRNGGPSGSGAPAGQQGSPAPTGTPGPGNR